MAIKTLVLGYGLSAKVFHLPFLLQNQDFEVVGISTGQPLLQAHAALGWRKFSDATQAMQQIADVDLVVVTTPNQSHAALVEQALLRGCHVVVEKPLCTDSNTALQLAALAEQQQRLLIPYFNRRYDDDFLSLQQWLCQHQPHILVFESRYDRFRPMSQQRWKEDSSYGNGVLFDLAPHLIDQMLQLFGQPDAVTASLRCLRPSSPCIDYFQLQCHYPQFEAVLTSSPVQPRQPTRFDVQTLTGSWSCQGFDPQEQQLRFGKDTPSPRLAQWCQADGSIQHQQMQSGDYGLFYQQVASALLTQTPLPCTAAQAIVGLKLMEAALQSQQSGRRVYLKDKI